MHKLSVYILLGYKLVYNHSGKYLTQSNGIYYFIRRVPTDLSDQYKSNIYPITGSTQYAVPSKLKLGKFSMILSFSTSAAV